MEGGEDLDHCREGTLRLKISRLLAHATLKRRSGVEVRATALHAGNLSWGSRAKPRTNPIIVSRCSQ